MTRNVSKRRRRENSVLYSSDSAEEDSVSSGKEYYHKQKGKRKIREDADQDQQEEEKKEVEPSFINEEKVVQVCGICLTEEESERGKLDCCEHYFCFGCIMEWSKVESRCPTCKQRFVTVVRPPVPGMPRSRPRTFHIPLRNQVYEPSEEEIRLFSDPYLHVVCTECQEAGDERLLLLCDGCDAAAHTYCVGLGRSVPRGDWFCNMCSIQVQGFNSDEQEHDDESNDEQVAELDENDSRLTMLVAEVTPVQQRRPPRRAAAPRLNRAGGRHTRLHPAPAISQEAQALLNQEASQSSSSSSDVESTPGAARTLSSQRLIRQRVNDIRNNWDQLRRGELQFGSISRSPPRTRAYQAGHNQANGRLLSNTSSAVPEVALRDDLSQAWSMMEQARALRGDRAVPDAALVTRAGGNRDTSRGRVPTGGAGTTVHPSRFNQSQVHNVRTENARNDNQFVENRSRINRDQTQEQTSRRENVREGNRLAESRSRNQRDAAEEQNLRREGSYVIQTRSRDHRDQSEERNLRREIVRESNRLVENRLSGAHRGGRSSGRRDNDSVCDVQARGSRELRIGRDANEGNVSVRSIPGSSRENERQRVVDSNGSRAQLEDEEAHRPRTRRTSNETREMKEQVANYVKAELKPLYRLGHIDKEQHRSIARLATQELLTVFGKERSGPETRGFRSVSSACTHPSSPTTSSFLPNCCMQCVRHNVSKVVGVLVKRTVGIAIL